LKAEEEVRVTAQAIELRDHQSGVVEPAQGHCFLQLRPVVLLAALDLDVLGNKLPPSPIEKHPDRLGLSFQTQTGPALLGRADPEVADEATTLGQRHHISQPDAGAINRATQRVCRL